MRFVRIAVGALLVAALVAAGPAPPQIIAEPTSGSNLEIMDALLDGDVRQATIASLVAAGGDRAAVTALLDGAEGEQLLPVPDLDGDGLDDVVGLTRESRPGQTTLQDPYIMGVIARSGASGEVLWSAETLGATGAVVPTPSGFVLVAMNVLPGAVTQRLTAFRSDGTVQWERVDAGVVAGTAVQWPAYRGHVPRDDGGLVHLVQQVTYSYLWDSTVEPGNMTVTLIDDADGSMIRTLGRGGDGVPWSWAAPDLDGDGNGDILMTQAYAFGTTGEVVAFALDGTQLWSTTAAFRSNGFLVWPGDVTGDGVEDVAVGADSHSVTLISGADGQRVWERPGEWPSVIGDVNGDGLPDVGARTVSTLNFSSFVTDHAGYTGTGQQLFREQTSIPIDPGRGYSATTTTWLITADVDGDGSEDSFHDFDLTYADGVPLRDVGATSGRTGRRLWDRPIPLFLDGSVQGPGVDLAVVQTSQSTTFIEVLRGDTAERIWRVGVPGGGTLDQTIAAAADVNGDGLGDVVVTVVTRGGNGTLSQHGYVLDGRDGTVLW